MKLQNMKVLSMAAVLSVTLLAGCANERLEDELSYRQVGINCMAEGDYEKAVKAFENALKQHIGDVTETELDICFYKAAAQFASGNTDGALETYNALLDYDSQNANAYYLRGTLLLSQGDSENALKDYKEAVKYNAKDYELYVNIYENLAAHNLTEDGENYLNQAFSIKEDDAESLTWRGRIYYLLGEYDNAKTELEAAVAKESTLANLYLAKVYDETGDSEKASTLYQTYLASGTADSETMNALGEIELEKNNYEAAISYFEQGLAMETVTDRQELMANSILAYEYAGEFGKAYETAQEYVKDYPGDADVQRECTFLSTRHVMEEDSEAVPEETQSLESSEETTPES